MTLQNQVTQIILECAPVDMTIAQVRLMAAKLVALVDKPENKYPLAVANHDNPPTANNEQRNKNDPMAYSEELGWHKVNQASDAPSYKISSVNSAKADSPKSHMTVVAMADGLYRADNGKLSKIEPKPDLYKDDNCKIEGDNEDAGFTYAVYHPPISKENQRTILCDTANGEQCFVEYDNELNHLILYNWRMVSNIDELLRKAFLSIVISDDGVYVWRNGKRDKIVYDYNGEKFVLEESLKAMAELGISTPFNPKHTRSSIYEIGKGSALIELDENTGIWVIHGYGNLSDEKRDKLIGDFSRETGVSTVISDDKQWIWRNGECSRAEKWEVS